MQNEITGWFKREIFYNSDNDYLVGKIQVLHSNISKKELKQYTTDGYITIVGYMHKLLKENLYHFYGEFTVSNYGPQFMVSSYELEEKKDEESLIEFLSSDLFKGIGKKTARRIVTYLGTNAIDKIIKDRTILNEIPGISENIKGNIYDILIINYQSEKIIRYLLKHGFGSHLAKKIFNKYKENTISYIESNPYQLIIDIEGIGFKRADQLALLINYDLKSPNRVKAAIKFIFEEFCFSEGFTYITENQLLTKAKKFLNENSLLLTDEQINQNIKQLIEDKQIHVEFNKYYLPVLYQAEFTIAEKIQSILLEDLDYNFSETDVTETIAEIEKDINITYTEKQIDSIKKAIFSKITVITGGPGTGKTTLVNGLLKTYLKVIGKNDSNQIALVAPTGRAAKRMSETTNMEASTIHRLLGYQMTGHFTHDENNRLNVKLIIVDESSMLDVLLCSQLLKALNNSTQIVFVGDINQLPSVGPGEVLKNIIESDAVTVVRLDTIHRQNQDSSIVKLAHEINSGIISQDILTKQKDRNFIYCTNDKLLEHLKFIVLNASSKEFSTEQIQVLAPMYKGNVGIDKINETLQASLNSKDVNKKEITHFNKTYRLNDKVIQLVNRPEQNVMNGDIGYIKHVFIEDDRDDDVVLIVDFYGNEVSYSMQDLNDLSLAYCISIHKSQGSEFDIVVLVLSMSYSIMLRKKLLYTAITRAKKYLIIVGDINAYQVAVKNTRETIRQTSLKERIKSTNSSNKLIIDDYEFEKVKMVNITPYDFLET